MMYQSGNNMNGWMWLVLVVGFLSAGGLIVASLLLIRAATLLARAKAPTATCEHNRILS